MMRIVHLSVAAAAASAALTFLAAVPTQASLILSELALAGPGFPAMLQHGIEVSGGTQGATAMIVAADPDIGSYAPGHIIQQMQIPPTSGETTRAFIPGSPMMLGFEGQFLLLLFDGQLTTDYGGKNVNISDPHSTQRAYLANELTTLGISLVDYASIGATKTGNSGQTLTELQLACLNPAADLTHDDVLVPRAADTATSNWYRRLADDGTYGPWEQRAFGTDFLGVAELHSPEPATAMLLLTSLGATLARRRPAT
jgi:hypothetical protein